MIENKELRAIFLMLREELKDEDIPHRTTLRNRILEAWDEYVLSLGKQMKASSYPSNPRAYIDGKSSESSRLDIFYHGYVV